MGFSFVFIALQVIQLTSLKNSRIFWKMLQPCTHNFTLWTILIFTWIYHLQQLPRLNDILASFDTKQHVNFPTHIHGHWLDILITRSSCKNIQTPTVVDGLSDHNTVIADLEVPIAPAVSKHNMFYRAIHSINIASFMTDIITSDLVTHPKEHVSDLYKQYRQILKTLLDKHAPTKSKSVSQKPPAPWMTPEIIQSKRRRRYLERVWRQSGHARHGNVIYVTDKCQKQSRIITKTWSQITLLHQNSYRNA